MSRFPTIIATQPEWKSALDTFGASMRGSPSLPILGCILIQHQDPERGLSLTRTDRERQLRVDMTGRMGVEGIGEFAIDARKLTQIIAALPVAAEVRLQQSAVGRVTLTASLNGRHLARYQLSALDGIDFPLMDGRPDPAAGGSQPVRLTMPGKRLARQIGCVEFAMATQDVRYYLNGLLLEWRGTSLNLVATNGHCLAAIAMQAGIEGGDGAAILPRDTAHMLQRLALEAGNADLSLEVNGRLLRVAHGGVELISKLIDGRFPEWRRVVPPGPFTALWTLPVEDLTHALGRVRILAHDKYHGVRVECLAPDLDRILLRAVNQVEDEAEEALELEEPSAAPVEIGMNIDYLQGALGACPTPTITLHLTDGTSAAKLTPGEVTADEWQDDPEWVVMPMLL